MRPARKPMAMPMATGKPRTVELLAQLERSPRVSVAVTIDEHPDGQRYVSIVQWVLGKQEQWFVSRGIAVLGDELLLVANALVDAAEKLSEGAR